MDCFYLYNAIAIIVCWVKRCVAQATSSAIALGETRGGDDLTKNSTI